MKSKYSKEITFQPSTKRIYPNGNKNEQFAKSYNWLIRRKELSPGAKHIYNSLTQFAGAKNFARVKQETLALETAFCVAQVRSYTKELVHFALIEVQQIGLNKANLYYFLDHPWKYEEKKVTKQKHHYPIVNKQDDEIPERLDLSDQETPHVSGQDRLDLSDQETLHVSGQDRLDLSDQETLHVSGQDRLDPSDQEATYLSAPLNRSSEKIPLKEHTQKRKSVCVSSSEISAYSKEQWGNYTKVQKNVHSPKALANELAKSKENDHLMKEFLDNQEKEKEKQVLEVQEQKQKDLKREQERIQLINRLLAQKQPLSDSERFTLEQLLSVTKVKPLGLTKGKLR